MKLLWRLIWTLSETFGIPLGRCAPFVFGRMVGCKGKRLK